MQADEPPAGPGPDRSGLRPGRAGLRRRTRRFRDLDLKKTLFVLPNAITLAAVFCGFNALRIIAQADGRNNTEDFYRAALLLIFSMFFDLMDGRVARLTKTQSAFGLQIDSLADVISFGVAPALLVHQWVLYRYPVTGLLASFGFVACAAIRLARFNVLTSNSDGSPTVPSKYILGLPSPPASGVLISVVVANHAMDGFLGEPQFTPVILILTVVCALLMVSSVRFRSFKDMRLNTATLLLLGFVIGSSALIWNELRPQFVLVWLLSCYVLIGVFETLRDFVGRKSPPHPKPDLSERS